MKGAKFINLRGLVIIGAVLVAAVMISFLLTRGADGTRAEIRVDGRTVMTVDLARECEFAFSQNPHIKFKVEGGAIAFIESDCPDKTCVRTGFIKKPGQTATCLPNRVSARVIGDGGTDAVSFADGGGSP